MVRFYVFDQPDVELRDIQWVLLGSMGGYFALRSFLGGIMPVPTWKQALLAYVAMFVLLFVVLSLWFGLPDPREWSTTILPTLVGPAIIVGGYWLIARGGSGESNKVWTVTKSVDDNCGRPEESISSLAAKTVSVLTTLSSAFRK